jgi:hypothetical protein
MGKRSQSAIKEAAARAQATFATAEPGKLGDVVFWDLVQGWNAACGAVRAAWTAAGLDADADLPVAVDVESAFRRAVTAATRYASGHDCRVEACAPTPDAKRVAVVQLKRNGTVDGATVGVVVLRKGGASPNVETSDPHGIAERIARETLTTYEGRYSASDMRTATVTVLDRYGATPLRQVAPHVVYWQPATGAAVLRNVDAALQSSGAGRLYFVPMGSDREAREAAAAAANGGLEARLASFAAEADTWASAPPARASTIETRIADVERLRATGELYRAILGEAVASVDARLDALQAGLRRTLGIVEANADASKRA